MLYLLHQSSFLTFPHPQPNGKYQEIQSSGSNWKEKFPLLGQSFDFGDMYTLVYFHDDPLFISIRTSNLNFFMLVLSLFHVIFANFAFLSVPHLMHG